MGKGAPKEDKRKISEIYKRAGKNASPAYKNRMRNLHDRRQKKK